MGGHYPAGCTHLRLCPGILPFHQDAPCQPPTWTLGSLPSDLSATLHRKSRLPLDRSLSYKQAVIPPAAKRGEETSWLQRTPLASASFLCSKADRLERDICTRCPSFLCSLAVPTPPLAPPWSRSPDTRVSKARGRVSGCHSTQPSMKHSSQYHSSVLKLRRQSTHSPGGPTSLAILGPLLDAPLLPGHGGQTCPRLCAQLLPTPAQEPHLAHPRPHWPPSTLCPQCLHRGV